VAQRTLKGTWAVPAEVYWIHVWALGGGGAGGSKAAHGAAFLVGGGGGAGGICERTIPVTPGQEIPITIGAGGYPEGFVTPPPGGVSVIADGTVDTTLDDFQPGDGARTTVGMPPYHVIALGGKRGEAVSAEGGDGASGESYTVVIDGVEVVVPRIAGAAGESGFVSLGLGITRSGKGADSFFGGGGVVRSSADPAQAGAGNASRAGAGGAGGFGLIDNRDRYGGTGGNGLVIIRY
jgi:hypothetical protein